MSLRVLLVDDEPLALDRLRISCARIPGIEVVGTAKDGEAALRAATTLTPDVVLLDIQMPGLDGIAAAEALGPDGPDVVFVTAFDRYAAAAFEVEAADYLLKPVKFERLQLAFARAERRKTRRALAQDALASLRAPPDKPSQGFWIAVRNGRVWLDIADILWIEGAGDYVLFHTANRSHIQRTTMTALGEKLSATELMRIHRSFFARRSAVTAVEQPGHGLLRLTLSDGTTLAVGASYAKAVIAALGLADYDGPAFARRSQQALD